MMSEGTPPPGDVAVAPAERFSSVVTGDRLCTGCGYNLVGQSIVREPHYQLLIVRCPECATIASVQEYPLLGQWARRWGVVLAVLLCIFLAAAFLASSGIIFGWGTVAAQEASWNYQRYIESAFNEHVIQQQKASGAAANQPQAGGAAPPGAASQQTSPAQTVEEASAADGAGSDEAATDDAAGGDVAGAEEVVADRANPAGASTVVISPAGTINSVSTTLPPQMMFATNPAVFQTWWSQQNTSELLSEVGGWLGVVDRDALWAWVPAWICAGAIGWFWSIALLQVRRHWVLVFGLFILGMSGTFALMSIAGMMTTNAYWAGQAAERQIGPPVLLFTIACCVIPMWIGIWFGRPLTRLIVRALLTPRVRSSLVVLWTAEGLSPPKT